MRGKDGRTSSASCPRQGCSRRGEVCNALGATYPNKIKIHNFFCYYLDSLRAVEVPVTQPLAGYASVDNGSRRNISTLANLVGFVLSEHSRVSSLVDDNNRQFWAKYQ